MKIYLTYVCIYIVQLRGTWPTHTQNLCTLFAFCAKKKKLPQSACLKHVFAFVIQRSQLALFRGNLVLSTELIT